MSDKIDAARRALKQAKDAVGDLQADLRDLLASELSADEKKGKDSIETFISALHKIGCDTGDITVGYSCCSVEGTLKGVEFLVECHYNTEPTTYVTFSEFSVDELPDAGEVFGSYATDISAAMLYRQLIVEVMTRVGVPFDVEYEPIQVLRECQSIRFETKDTQ